MKTDGGWIERGQMGCRGVGSGTRQREGRTTARGGGFEWFSCSGTVAEIGRSCSFFRRFACVVVTRALLLRSVCFVSFRLASFRFISSRRDGSRPPLVHRLSPPPLASDQALGSSTGRAVHAASVTVFPFPLQNRTQSFRTCAPAAATLYPTEKYQS